MNRFLYILGFIALALGIIGIFLPVLPTTPFLLLSSALFLRSSKKMYDWLMNHRVLGPYISDFLKDRSIPLKAKITSITLLWVSLICCAIFVSDKLFLRLLFIGIAIGVSIHILSFKTRK